MRRSIAHLSCVAALASCGTAKAIVLYNYNTNVTTGDPTSHTTAPTGTLANSGWKYQGDFSTYLPFSGTAIGPHSFITATHTAVSNGNTFAYNGGTYTVTSVTPIGRDMSIARVSGTLPYWAPIYSSTDGAVAGKTVVDMGRGTQRGNPINSVSRPGEGTLRGWDWGPLDSLRRWGTNVVNDVYTEPGTGDKYLRYTFDRVGGLTDEATLSGGDSGGGAFMQATDGVWKLAGVNHGVVPDKFRYAANTPNTPVDPLDSSCFDYSDLYLLAQDNLYHQAQEFFPGVDPIPQATQLANLTDLAASTFAPYVPHAGDANCDGKVNALDFNTVAANFGVNSGAIWTTGDFNYDGKVNAADFTILTSNFNYSGVVPGEVLGGPASSGVPEPGALGLIAIAGLGLRRRTKHFR